MKFENSIALERLRRIWESPIPEGSQFLLSIPAPALRLGMRLWDLENLSEETRASLDLSRRTTSVHTTVLSPRPATPAFPWELLAETVAKRRPWTATLLGATHFPDSGLIVGTYDDPEPFRQLHAAILETEGLPPGDLTYEGERYNPHVTFGRTTDPARDLDFLVRELNLPCRWEICRLDVHVKFPKQRIYQEAAFFLFE